MTVRAVLIDLDMLAALGLPPRTVTDIGSYIGKGVPERGKASRACARSACASPA